MRYLHPNTPLYQKIKQFNPEAQQLLDDVLCKADIPINEIEELFSPETIQGLVQKLDYLISMSIIPLLDGTFFPKTLKHFYLALIEFVKINKHTNSIMDALNKFDAFPEITFQEYINQNKV